ncbi:hypothetical protein MSEN_12400 [Mycolicibacter senuensis]|uniref:Uncharacterized protein n=1 Tax=Mycolicibacter senuensis TaxID=386913 RepID=A0A7I9XJ04_9MYCO|nr:hypothetical protein MSEN_12400 [Mycolicibacter senuensis]
MQSIYSGKEQPYPPQMTRYLDPMLLWTVAATATSRIRLNASTLSTFYYEPSTSLARQSPHGAIVGRSDGLGGHCPVVRNSQGCIPIASARFRCSATPSGIVR